MEWSGLFAGRRRWSGVVWQDPLPEARASCHRPAAARDSPSVLWLSCPDWRRVGAFHNREPLRPRGCRVRGSGAVGICRLRPPLQPSVAPGELQDDANGTKRLGGSSMRPAIIAQESKGRCR